MLSDDLKCFFFLQKCLKFCSGFQLNRKTLHVPCIFFRWFGLRFSRYYVCKNLYLLLRQERTAKMVISLKIQQNIDLLQHATLKSVDFR